MPGPGHDPEEVCRRGQEFYDRDIRARVEPEHIGTFLVLDIGTGDSEIDAKEGPAIDRAVAKIPTGFATSSVSASPTRTSSADRRSDPGRVTVARVNPMPVPRQELEDVARRAEEIYERDLRAVVEPDHTGKFLLLDVETGEYEIDRSELAAGRRAEAKRPGGARSRFLFRIGYPAAHTIGGWSIRPTR